MYHNRVVRLIEFFMPDALENFVLYRTRGRVGGQLPPFDAPCEETAQGRNAPRERAGCVAAFAQPGDEQRDVFVVEAAEGRFQLVEEVPERVQILPVGGDGVAREPPVRL